MFSASRRYQRALLAATWFGKYSEDNWSIGVAILVCERSAALYHGIGLNEVCYGTPLSPVKASSG